MKIITLYHSKCGNKDVLVDDEDYERIKYFNLNLNYHNENKIYVRFRKNNIEFKLHRYIMNVNDPKVQVDHINGNKLDNRKENLRICDIFGNAKNKQKHKIRTSKYKGVHWRKNRSRWSAEIRVNKILVKIGSFKDEDLAAKAYDQAARLFFKEFSCLNFPNEILNIIDEKILLFRAKIV